MKRSACIFLCATYMNPQNKYHKFILRILLKAVAQKSNVLKKKNKKKYRFDATSNSLDTKLERHLKLKSLTNSK